MGNLAGESREQNRKDEVTRCPPVTYARQVGLLVNTLGSHLKLNEHHNKFLLKKIKAHRNNTALFHAD